MTVYRVLPSLCFSLAAEAQRPDFQRSLFSYKQMPAQSEVIPRGRYGRPPESLSSGNVTCDVLLGEVVRNTGSSLSAISPWGNKRTVTSYLPESTKEAPKHELIKGTGYFKLHILKRQKSATHLTSQLSSPLRGSTWNSGVPGHREVHLHTRGGLLITRGSRGYPRISESTSSLDWLPSGLSQHASHQDSLQFLQRSKSSMSFKEGPELPQKSISKADEHTAQ